MPIPHSFIGYKFTFCECDIKKKITTGWKWKLKKSSEVMEISVVIINLSSCVHLKNILLVENSLNDLKINNTTKINNIIQICIIIS